VGIFDRINILAKSNINDLIDKAEDPEKIAKQVIYDLETALREASTGVAASITEEKKLKALIDECEDESERWEKRAMTAIEKGEDDLAKEALKRKGGFDNDLVRYRESHTVQLEQVKMLKDSLRMLEGKIEDAKRRRDSLIARSKSAEAQKKIAETMSKASKLNPLDVLDRMEDKVAMVEAQAQAYTELKQDSLEDKFAELDKESGADDALAALKAKMAKDKENA
jgi:phage shock protein A